jgi:L,D-transpeptidase YcbB
VVINPPWNVPASIANAEILPRAARDPGYLTRNGFRYVDGRLQQRPGAANALGRLKFDLQSPYGVYLHDTPSKSAFARPTRTLSHGCMRLEQPQALAAWLLARQGWTPSRLEAAIGQGATQRIALQTPPPLLVVYRTAFGDRTGARLWPDPYGWDTALGAALGHSQVAEDPRGATECAEAAAG